MITPNGIRYRLEKQMSDFSPEDRMLIKEVADFSYTKAQLLITQIKLNQTRKRGDLSKPS